MRKTVTITYSGSSVDVDREQRLAMDAGKFWSALLEMSQWIRAKQKYEEGEMVSKESVASAFRECLGDIDLYGYD